MGKVALPELARLNYSPRLATGTLAAGGTLGILIPPSIALVIYAIIVEASIIQMFQAAIIPGLIAVLFFITVIAVLVRRNPELAPQTTTMTQEERREAYRKLLPVILIFGSIILGLGMGLFTPTPAAGVGATIILIYGIYLRLRNPNEGITLSGVKTSLLDTAVTSGMIYFILFGAEVLKGFFAKAGLPAAMAAWAANSGFDPWVVMVLILLVLIILGCFMDSLAMILVVVPFFWPALVDVNGGEFATAASSAYGMGTEELKIWFGILALVVVELGLITPPVGLNVFIISALAKDVPMREIFQGVMPFFSVEIFRTALLLAIPALSLFLPRLLAG
jgi:tripartite ATP-independent transporter DctM subunit